jgi:hypothetical protein
MRRQIGTLPSTHSKPLIDTISRILEHGQSRIAYAQIADGAPNAASRLEPSMLYHPETSTEAFAFWDEYRSNLDIPGLRISGLVS